MLEDEVFVTPKHQRGNVVRLATAVHPRESVPRGNSQAHGPAMLGLCEKMLHAPFKLRVAV